MKRRIAVTTGSRSEYGILRSVIDEILISKKLDLILIVSGMHLSKKFGATLNEIKRDGFRIDAKIDMIPKGNSTFHMAQAIGNGILGFSKAFLKLKPDINLVLGDRDEAFASAIAASHMNIPNAHIHGGDKSKAGIDEYNRHAITKISNIHFAATKKSKERIIRMGEDPRYVFYTGTPSKDDIMKGKITSKENLKKKYGLSFDGNEIILLQHPVTTESRMSHFQIRNTLKAIVKTKKNTIAIAPNSDAGNNEIFKNLQEFSQKYKFVKMYKNLSREDYLGVLKNGGILVGNSSSGIIESSYLGLPVVNVGIRQKDRERSENVIDTKDDSTQSIYLNILKAFKQKERKSKVKKFPYGRDITSKKIISILENISIDKDLIQKQIHY